MQIEKKVTFQRLEQHSIENKTQEKSESTNNQKDIFESKIEVLKESALLEKIKAENDYYKANVEGTVNSKDEEQIADDQSQNVVEAKELFKQAMQMLLDSERRKAAVRERV